VVAGRLGVIAGKTALLPLRVVARSPLVGPALGRAGEGFADVGRIARARGASRLEGAAVDAAASPEAARAVDRALAGPLPEAVARSLVEQQVLQRLVAQALASAQVTSAVELRKTPAADPDANGAGLDRLVAGALESKMVADVADQVIASAELQRLVEEIVASPAVRAAITRQTASLGDELAAGIRARIARFDDATERAARRKPAALTGERYGGLGVRAVAFVIDMVATLIGFLVVAAVGALIGHLVGGFKPAWLAGLLAGIGWSTVVAGYLVTCWTVTGATLGMRAMRLRVIGPSGAPPGFGRSAIRLVGLVLAIVPVLAGFLPVPFDGRRRALQDYLAGTVVRAEDPPAPL
jgi:uncharacterized RDD family membrane protein YckC